MWLNKNTGGKKPALCISFLSILCLKYRRESCFQPLGTFFLKKNLCFFCLKVCTSTETAYECGRTQPLHPFSVQVRWCHGDEHDFKGEHGWTVIEFAGVIIPEEGSRLTLYALLYFWIFHPVHILLTQGVNWLKDFYWKVSIDTCRSCYINQAFVGWYCSYLRYLI